MLVMVVIAGKITVGLQDHEVVPFVIRERSPLVSKSEGLISQEPDHSMLDILLHY